MPGHYNHLLPGFMFLRQPCPSWPFARLLFLTRKADYVENVQWFPVPSGWGFLFALCRTPQPHLDAGQRVSREVGQGSPEPSTLAWSVLHRKISYNFYWKKSVFLKKVWKLRISRMKHKTLPAVITALLPSPNPVHKHLPTVSLSTWASSLRNLLTLLYKHYFFWGVGGESWYYANTEYLEIIFHVSLPTILYVPYREELCIFHHLEQHRCSKKFLLNQSVEWLTNSVKRQRREWAHTNKMWKNTKAIPPCIFGNTWLWIYSLGIQENRNRFHNSHDHIWGLCKNSDFRYVRFI